MSLKITAIPNYLFNFAWHDFDRFINVWDLENCHHNSRQTGIRKVSAGIVDAQLGGGMKVDFYEFLGN